MLPKILHLFLVVTTIHITVVDTNCFTIKCRGMEREACCCRFWPPSVPKPICAFMYEKCGEECEVLAVHDGEPALGKTTNEKKIPDAEAASKPDDGTGMMVHATFTTTMAMLLLSA